MTPSELAAIKRRYATKTDIRYTTGAIDALWQQCREDVMALAERVEELESASKWTAVEDGLPAVPGDYFVATDTGKMFVCYYFCDGEIGMNGWEDADDITHWQPLPERPQ